MQYNIVLTEVHFFSIKNCRTLYQNNFFNAGVPELAKGGGLKILWRRPTWVRIPSPALI